MRTNFLRAPEWQPHLLHLNRTQHPGAAQYELTYHLSDCHTMRQHCGIHPMTLKKKKTKNSFPNKNCLVVLSSENDDKLVDAFIRECGITQITEVH